MLLFIYVQFRHDTSYHTAAGKSQTQQQQQVKLEKKR
jgi:hypothetical protein